MLQTQNSRPIVVTLVAQPGDLPLQIRGFVEHVGAQGVHLANGFIADFSDIKLEHPNIVFCDFNLLAHRQNHFNFLVLSKNLLADSIELRSLVIVDFLNFLLQVDTHVWHFFWVLVKNRGLFVTVYPKNGFF